MCFAFCGCGTSSKKLVGNWICEEVHNGYPDQMTLNADGTGIAEGYTCNWYCQDGILTISVGNMLIGTKTYNYEVKGSVLYLDGYSYTH